MKVDPYRGEKHIDLFDMFMIVLVFACVGFFIWGVYQLFVWKPPPYKATYGCEQVYKAPPVWRCGRYGSGANNKNIIYTEAWVTEEKYFTKKGE